MSLRDIYADGFDESVGKTPPTANCSECDGAIITDGGERSCTDCGLVVDADLIDPGPEWTKYGEANGKRTGAPLTPARHDRGLSTEIGYTTDGTGAALPGGKRRRLSRQRQLNARASYQSTGEYNLAYACSEIARMTGAMDLSRSVREEASRIYREAQAADLITGRSIETLAAGSLYAACRCRGYPRTPGEVAAVARCDRAKVLLGYRVLNAELDLETQVLGVRDHIPNVASACDVRNEVRQRADALASVAADAGLANGRNPAGVAAACLYAAGVEFDAGYTQAELAAVAGVTTATVRKRVYELRDELPDA